MEKRRRAQEKRKAGQRRAVRISLGREELLFCSVADLAPRISLEVLPGEEEEERGKGLKCTDCEVRAAAASPCASCRRAWGFWAALRLSESLLVHHEGLRSPFSLGEGATTVMVNIR